MSLKKAVSSWKVTLVNGLLVLGAVLSSLQGSVGYGALKEYPLVCRASIAGHTPTLNGRPIPKEHLYNDFAVSVSVFRQNYLDLRAERKRQTRTWAVGRVVPLNRVEQLSGQRRNFGSFNPKLYGSVPAGNIVELLSAYKLSNDQRERLERLYSDLIRAGLLKQFPPSSANSLRVAERRSSGMTARDAPISLLAVGQGRFYDYHFVEIAFSDNNYAKALLLHYKVGNHPRDSFSLVVPLDCLPASGLPQ